MAIIGIDYTPAHHQGGGIGRYVRELTNALTHAQTEHTYRLFVAGATSKIAASAPLPNATYTPTRLSDRWLARLWHKAHLPLPVEHFTGPLDLFHATDFVLPPTRRHTRTLLTVHDLSYLKAPETAVPQLRRYLSQVVPRSLAHADHILADSQATQRDLAEVYQVPPERVTVLLSGVSNHFHPVTDKAQLSTVRQRYQIDERPYIFAVGTVQPRKNYARLVQALAQLRQRGHDIQLVIAGGRGWLESDLHHAITKTRMTSHVQLIGFAEDTDIPALYTAATASAFMSLYEGFGLPVLEAMACGTPVITSNVSSMPEVAGDVAPTIDPLDVNAIADALERIITDSDHAADLRQRGLRRAQQFTWERAARQLLDVYHQVLHS